MMKKNFITIILTSFFFVLSFVVTAQTTSPLPPGDDPGTSDPGGSQALGGGGAPIGTGTFILIGLAAAYAGKKGYTLYKDNQEELES